MKAKESAPLTNIKGADILQIEKVLTGKRLASRSLVVKKD